jgi:hypothetical protein
MSNNIQADSYAAKFVCIISLATDTDRKRLHDGFNRVVR